MAKKKSKKEDNPKNDQPAVNPELKGFNVEIDSFGELKTSYNIDKINDFLNKNVEDKKLLEREDYKKLKKGKSSEEEE